MVVHPLSSLRGDLEIQAQQGETPPPEDLREFPRLGFLWKEQALLDGRSQLLPYQPPMGQPAIHEALIELEPTELALLQSVNFEPAALGRALEQLKREEANPAFWGEGPRLIPWWAGESNPLDTLRRFCRYQGFYAHYEQLAGSLEAWSQRSSSLLSQGSLAGGSAFWSAEESAHWLALPLFLALSQGQRHLPPMYAAPNPDQLLDALEGQHVLYVGPAAEAVGQQFKQAHSQRVLHDREISSYTLSWHPLPESRHPLRPHDGFEQSLQHCLDGVDRLQEETGATLAVIGGGAYRMPLIQELRQRYKLRCLGIACGANQLFGVELPGDPPWWSGRRDHDHWQRVDHSAA